MGKGGFLGIAAAALMGLATAGHAATYTPPTSGVWISVEGTSSVNGIGTSAINWGGGRSPSSYTFAPDFFGQPVELGRETTLGIFTHRNGIVEGDVITAADLVVTAKLWTGDAVRMALRFTHDETLNFGAPCPYVSDWNGCADGVTVAMNTAASDVIDIGGTDYMLTLTGLIPSSSSTLTDSIITRETGTTYTRVRAQLREYTPVVSSDPLAVVPVPASLALLAGGLGLLTLMGRRRA